MVGIIFCNELNMCPYIQKYIDSLEKNKIEYKVLLWNRTGEQKQYPDNYVIYRRKSELYIPKWKKIGAFAGYTLFLYANIRKYKFDKLIMLTTLPAVLCGPILLWKYKKRYLYDFRDMSFEQIVPFRKFVDKLIKESYFTSVSSPGYKSVIKGRTINSHNFRYGDLEHRVLFMKPAGDRITLLHIGISRGEEYNRRLADLFGNDTRFEIIIAGTGNDTPSFAKYIEQFDNMRVVGTYNNEEKGKFIEKCDALLYYYPCNFNNNRALANKYYDGLIYMKPLIGNINTYSGRRIEEKRIGLSIDIEDDSVPEKIYQYMHSINKAQYADAVRQELEKVIEEDKKYMHYIEDFLIRK